MNTKYIIIEYFYVFLFSTNIISAASEKGAQRWFVQYYKWRCSEPSGCCMIRWLEFLFIYFFHFMINDFIKDANSVHPHELGYESRACLTSDAFCMYWECVIHKIFKELIYNIFIENSNLAFTSSILRLRLRMPSFIDQWICDEWRDLLNLCAYEILVYISTTINIFLQRLRISCLKYWLDKNVYYSCTLRLIPIQI